MSGASGPRSARLARVAEATGQRAPYRAVLADRELRALLLADAFSVLGDQVARIAVALLVFTRTGSPLAAAATYAASYLTWLVGGPLLSVLADRHRRRELMIVCDLLRFALVGLLLLPGASLALVFAVVVLVGLITPPFEAARSALLADLVEGEVYLAANGLTNALSQAGQVGGFLVGGALVATIGTRGALAVDAATFALSAAALALRVAPRAAPASDPGTGAGELAAGLRLVRGRRELWTLLALGVLGALALSVPEALAVPVAGRVGGGAAAAGLLTASLPAGFVLGSAVLLPRIRGDRRRLLLPLLALSTLPLLVTPALDSWPLIALVWLVAGAGSVLQLVANAAFVAAVPAHLRGRAFGVASTALMAVQGVGALAAGAAARSIGPRTAVAATAAVVLLAGALVRRPGREGARHAVKG